MIFLEFFLITYNIKHPSISVFLLIKRIPLINRLLFLVLLDVVEAKGENFENHFVQNLHPVFFFVFCCHSQLIWILLVNFDLPQIEVRVITNVDPTFFVLPLLL